MLISAKLGSAHSPDQCNFILLLLAYIISDMTSLPSRAPMQVINLGKLSVKQHICRVTCLHAHGNIVTMTISRSSMHLKEYDEHAHCYPV